MKGIGEGHLWEFEPFLSIGIVSGNVELVSLTRFGIPTNQRVGEEVETEIHYDMSALYHFSTRVQGLLELNGEAGLSGEEAGQGIISVSPGIKVAPLAESSLFVVLGGSFPLGDEELDAGLKLALFYHFLVRERGTLSLREKGGVGVPFPGPRKRRALIPGKKGGDGLSTSSSVRAPLALVVPVASGGQ